jgi:FkbM family methyltransferase
MSTTAFVLQNSAYGTLIVNRFDYNYIRNKWYGVGAQLLETGTYDPDQSAVLKQLLTQKRERAGDGVVVLDCGANIGVLAVDIANFMRGWGFLIAIEPQERLFYALCGNLAVNNCFNARAIWAAVDAENGFIDIPEPDYRRPGSFGSFELRQQLGTEPIGQPIDYSKPTSTVNTITTDRLELKRLDLLKLDVEGMELAALNGAIETIRRTRPMIYVEVIKTERDAVEALLAPLDYKLFAPDQSHALAMHRDDPVIECIQVIEKTAAA